MSIKHDLDEIEGLLSSLRDKVDDEAQDFLKEISVLNDEIEMLKAQNEEFQKNVEDLVNRNYLLNYKVAKLELELVEEVMKNKTV
jgi:hypothetical protein